MCIGLVLECLYFASEIGTGADDRKQNLRQLEGASFKWCQQVSYTSVISLLIIWHAVGTPRAMRITGSEVIWQSGTSLPSFRKGERGGEKPLFLGTVKA